MAGRIETPEDLMRRVSNLPARWIVIAVVVVAALVLLANTFFTIEPEEIGIVQVFGKYDQNPREPGLRTKIPFISKLTRVPVQRQLKQEFGFRTASAGQRTRYAQQEFDGESLMLTGDLNVADVEWVVQYKVSDPFAFLFKVQSPVETFRDMSEAVMREVVGDHAVDEVLTTGRTAIAEQAKLKLQELCKLYEIGIIVDQVVLQDVNPPQPVQASFNEVNEAIQERERSINEAWAEYNKAVPRARGEAEQMIRRAEGYELERVNNAKGEAARFEALYEQYRKAPAVTRKRLYLESVERLLPKLGDKIIVDNDLEGFLPLMNLSTDGAASKGGAR